MTRSAPLHLVFALIFLAVVGGAYIGWYAFVQSESARVVTLAGQVAARSVDAKQASAAKAALASLTADESFVQSYFVVPTDVVPFLEKLQSTGKSFDATVEVASVSADNVKPRGHITISLKITGTFDAVMRTLGAIEYGPYDSSIGSVTLDRPAPSAATPAVRTPWTATATFVIGTNTSAK